MEEERRVLVTGAAGFIGSFLCPRLLESNYTVTALDINPESAQRLRAQGIETVICDLSDPDSLKGVTKAKQIIIHLAARLTPWGTRKMFYDAIYETTRNILEDIRGNAAPQFIYLSSICAAGAGGRKDHLTGLTEDDPVYRTGRSYYCDAKYDAERLVMKYHRWGVIRATIVRPANVIGPGSVWVADFADALIRKSAFPMIDNGKHHAALVYVENLVDGIMQTLDNAAAHGRTYHFRDDYDADWRTYIEDIARITGRKVRFSNVPFALAWAMATFADTFIKPFGLKVDLTRHTVGLTGRANDVDTARAKRELGWETRVSYETALHKIAQWMKTAGYTEAGGMQ